MFGVVESGESSLLIAKSGMSVRRRRTSRMQICKIVSDATPEYRVINPRYGRVANAYNADLVG
jgi:hypothetical protein